MRKHIILFFSALLFLFACNKAKAPEDLLDEDVFIRLLADVHIIDGSLANEPNVDSLYKYGTGRYIQIFRQYHTDSAQFKKTLRFYTTQTDKMAPVYDKVAEILKHKSDSLIHIDDVNAKKEMLRLQKIAKDANKVQAEKEKSNAQKEGDRLLLLKQEQTRREQEKKDKEFIEKQKQAEAKFKLDSAKNVQRIKQQLNKKNTILKKDALPQ